MLLLQVHRPNRLMRLLSVSFRRPLIRFRRQRLTGLGQILANGLHGLIGEMRAVRAVVGDGARFIQRLRQLHGAFRCQAEIRASGLLQCRSREGWQGAALKLGRLNRLNGQFSHLGHHLSYLPIQPIGLILLGKRREVPRCRPREWLFYLGHNLEMVKGLERPNGLLAFHNQTQGRRLHPAGRQAEAQLR